MSAQTMARRGSRLASATALVLVATTSWPAAAAQDGEVGSGPDVEGPLPGEVPGDPGSDLLEETYPFFSTPYDLAGSGFVEEEYYLSGEAAAYSLAGELLAEDVPYHTRLVVRRPADPNRFSGTVLMEWQNVTAGYDLDALWNPGHVTREGHAWVGVSAQRVGVDQLRDWSPTRYGDLNVTGGGRFPADELSYDIWQQAAQALRDPAGDDPMGGLGVERVLGIGASQSAGRMTVYYNSILPQVDEPTVDGYGFIVGSAPTREGDEPVMHVLAETDVRTPVGRRADSDAYRRWEVAGTAHSGWEGQVYRAPISERDLPGGSPGYDCDRPPFSRVPMSQVTTSSYDHLATWVEDGAPPPQAPYLEFDGAEMVRDELGHAQGGIQLSQVQVPTALNTGVNSGESFCRLFGSHEPFDDGQLAELYPNPGRYVAQVTRVDRENVRAGYISRADARANLGEATSAGVG
jgi:hypothetical protein